MRKKRKILALIAGILLLAFFSYTQNNWLHVSRYEVHSKRLPKAFQGTKILLISDLHGKTYGEGQEILYKKIEKEKPDMIFFAGDLVDKRNYNEKPGRILMKKLTALVPVYFVMGNHEVWGGHWDTLEKQLKEDGVRILENEGTLLEKGTDKIWIFGMSDPKTKPRMRTGAYTREVLGRSQEEEKKNGIGTDSYKLLLSHRPELFKFYQAFGFDLTLSGHTHGGQIQLPIIGGVIAPNQGLFPEYSKGLYKIQEASMIISGGLGNSVIPQRLFNRPEIIVITLLP